MGNGMDPEKKGEQAWKNGERDGNEDRSYLLPIVEMEMVEMAEMEMGYGRWWRWKW